MNKNTLSSITLVLAVILIVGGLIEINSPEFEPDLLKAIGTFGLGLVFAVATWALRKAVAKEEKQRRDK